MKNILHARTGPLSRELVREPSAFGLGQLPVQALPDATTQVVCGYCSTGCSLDIHLQQGSAVNLSPTTDYPVNLGMACPKGWESLAVLDASDRATNPLLRDGQGRLRAVDWPTALREFTGRFKDIQGLHGDDSVAFLSTGQLVTEEMAFLGALAKFGMGMLHGDGNTRQCMATSVVAYKESFGFDAPPYTYADFEESDVIVLFGSNLCIAHPIMWERVMRNPRSPEIIVVDPRATETAMQATIHLPLNPKSDLALCYGLARLLIERDAVDTRFVRAHTSGFAEFARFVDSYDLDHVTTATGLAAHVIERTAATIAAGPRVSFWWTMGVNQSHQGVRTAQAIINLALMTGNIGKPGTGANSITGQCNAMGSRLFSNTTNLLGGHEFSSADDRGKVAGVLGIESARIPHAGSMAYNEIMESILRGQIRGLWIVCTNTADSWINQTQARDILSRLDFLVVQDLYSSTATAQMADLVLPAAGWGEKEGTFINSERRIGVVRKVRRAPGRALSDFRIFRLIANAWGCGELFEKWTSPEVVFRLLAECTRGMPCDMTGVQSYAAIQAARGIQWPWPEKSGGGKPSAERRLFADGRFFHADRRAKFVFEEPRPLSEPTTDSFPLTLLTGRGSAAQWHTQTRTSKSAVLRKLYPADAYVEVAPADARPLGLRTGSPVRVCTRRGAVNLTALVTPGVQPGQIFVPMHYSETNVLTDAVFDPYSKQPAYKACAARIEAPL